MNKLRAGLRKRAWGFWCMKTCMLAGSVSLQPRKEENILCCIYKSSQWVKGVKSHLKYCTHPEGPQHKKDKDLSQKGQGIMVLN